MERQCDNHCFLMLKEEKSPFPSSLSFRKIFLKYFLYFLKIAFDQQCWSNCIVYSIYFFSWTVLRSILVALLNHHNFSWTLFFSFFSNGGTLVSWSSHWQNGPKYDTYQRPIWCPANPSQWENLHLNWCLLIYKGMFLRQIMSKVNQRRCWPSRIMLYNFIQNAPLAPSSASWQS